MKDTSQLQQRAPSLIVSECFYSIQGEGQCSGYPAVFLRLAGCNLLCEGSGWRCDTIEVWKHGKSIPFPEVITIPWWIGKLKAGAHLVITGGEPLLHQDSIVEYLKWFYITYKFAPFVEIETNGTIEPHYELIRRVNVWNVSFKLSSVGEPYHKRINEMAIQTFNRLNSATFKIVISSEEDLMELLTEFNIDVKKLILMPAGETQEQLNITRPLVVEMCKGMCLRYCDRLHIVTWNQKTGV